MSYDRAPDYDIRGADVPRELFPTGRVRFSLGTTSKRSVRRRREALNQLRADQEWDIIAAVKDGTIPIDELMRRLRQGGERAIPELRADAESRRAGGVPTVREEADRYLKWYGQKRGAQSLKQVRSRLKRVLEQEVEGRVVGGMPIDALRSTTLEQAIGQVSQVPRTFAGLLAAASGLYRWSIESEADSARVEKRSARWTVNPARGVEAPDIITRRSRPRTLSEEQVRALLAGAQLYQIAYIRAFLHCGLRLSELTHTRMHLDLDPKRWTWSIQARGPNPDCGCVQCKAEGWSPKTDRGHRSFQVPGRPSELREALTAYLEAYPVDPGEPFFRNPRTGRWWDDTALQRDFRGLCESVGVEYGRGSGVTLHTFRHTSITNLVRAGVRESVIAHLHGDTVQTIVRVYVHLTPADLADAISKGPRYA